MEDNLASPSISMPNLKRDNHYLPVCYQRGFTDSSDRVWVKFADKPEPAHRRPLTVGRKRSLYIWTQGGAENDKVEDFFNEHVETPFAALSQRIKTERHEFAKITDDELGTLCRFVASQTMRTLAHKAAIQRQAGLAVDTNTFVRVTLRKIIAVLDGWLKNRPEIYFHTPLPFVGEQFITGDNPVLVVQTNDNAIWVPTDTPTLKITDVQQIVNDPKHRLWFALSPYVLVSIQGFGGGGVHLPPKTEDPLFVRNFNRMLRGQSDIFTLARDKAYLT
jgi:hypothetical protein